MMETFKMTLLMEFRADGTASMGIEAPPEMEKLLAKSGEKTMMSFKYKLSTGDVVEFYDLPKEMQEKSGGGLFGKKDRAKVYMKINGDNMTLSDDATKDKPVTLTKMP